MTIKDEILEELRKGTPLSEISRKFRSQSRKYEAIREYLEEAEKIVEEMQKIKTDLLERKVELERSNHEKAEISREIQISIQAKEKLDEEVIRKTGELKRLKTDIRELQERGVTPEILSKIMAIEIRSGPGLLRQIKTVERLKQTKRQVSNLKKSKVSLEETIRNLGAKKEELEKKLRSERNQLDQLKIETATFREAVATVGSFYTDGYSTEDLKSLKHGLGTLGIKGDPLLSITRVVTGLSKYKNLVALENKIRTRQKELETLKRAITDEKSLLKVKGQLIKAFGQVKDTGVKAILRAAEHAKAEIADTAGMSEKHTMALLSKFDVHVRSTLDGLKTELGEWGELKEQEGQLREILRPAQVLLGILKSPEYLRQLPLTFVFQLFDRLRLYLEMNLKDVTIKPSQDIWKKDANLNFILSYRLPVLLEFVCEGLREIMTQQSMKE